MDGFLTEFGGSKNGFFSRNIYVPRDEGFADRVSKLLANFNNTDVYYGVYNYQSDDIAKCALYGSPYIDLDLDIKDDEGFDEVRHQTVMAMQYFEKYFGIPLEMQQVYFSGSKGFHVVIPATILGITPDTELNIKFKKLAGLVAKSMDCNAIDLRIYDRKRLFRIPNTINGKTGLYKVPVPINLLWSCSLEEMKEWASEPREIHFDEPMLIHKSAIHYHTLFRLLKPSEKAESKPKKRDFEIPTTQKELLPCTKEILSTGVQKGQRNNTTVALASSLMQSGKQLKDTIEILEEWNEFNDPPLDEKELHTTAISAYSMLKSGRTYGCAYFKELGVCAGKDCKLNE